MAQPGRDKANQQDRKISEGMNVQRVNKVIDVKHASEQIEEFQNECEQRNAAKHHRGQVAHQSEKENFRVNSVLPDFFFGPLASPFLERRRICVIFVCPNLEKALVVFWGFGFGIWSGRFVTKVFGSFLVVRFAVRVIVKQLQSSKEPW